MPRDWPPGPSAWAERQRQMDHRHPDYMSEPEKCDEEMRAHSEARAARVRDFLAWRERQKEPAQ